MRVRSLAILQPPQGEKYRLLPQDVKIVTDLASRLGELLFHYLSCSPEIVFVTSQDARMVGTGKVFTEVFAKAKIRKVVWEENPSLKNKRRKGEIGETIARSFKTPVFVVDGENSKTFPQSIFEQVLKRKLPDIVLEPGSLLLLTSKKDTSQGRPVVALIHIFSDKAYYEVPLSEETIPA